MILKDVLESYKKKTGTASTISRQLGFAGIAIIWLFVSQYGEIFNIPNELILPAILIVISLAFDLLQYVVGGLIYGIFNTKMKKLGFKLESEVVFPGYLNRPALIFYYSKIITIFIAYGLILSFLISHLNIN